MNSKELLRILDGNNFISGNFIKTSNEFIDVINPSTLSKIGEIPISTQESIKKSIDISQEAFLSWK